MSVDKHARYSKAGRGQCKATVSIGLTDGGVTMFYCLKPDGHDGQHEAHVSFSDGQYADPPVTLKLVTNPEAA